MSDTKTERAIARYFAERDMDALRESLLMSIFRHGKSVLIHRYPDGAPGGRGGQFAPNPGGARKRSGEPDAPDPGKAPSAPSTRTSPPPPSASAAPSRAVDKPMSLPADQPKADEPSLAYEPGQGVMAVRAAKVQAWARDLEMLRIAREDAALKREQANPNLPEARRQAIAAERERMRLRYGVIAADARDAERVRTASKTATKVVGHPDRGARGDETPTDLRITRSLWRRQETEAGHQERRVNRAGIEDRLQQAIAAVTGKAVGNAVWAEFEDEFLRIRSDYADSLERNVPRDIASSIYKQNMIALGQKVNERLRNYTNPLTGTAQSFPPAFDASGEFTPWWSTEDPWEKAGFKARDFIEDASKAVLADRDYDESLIPEIDETARMMAANRWVMVGTAGGRKLQPDIALKVDPAKVVSEQVDDNQPARAREALKVVSAVVNQQAQNATIRDTLPTTSLGYAVYHDEIKAALSGSPLGTEDEVRAAIKRARKAADDRADRVGQPELKDAIGRAHRQMSDTLDAASSVIRKRARGITTEPDKSVGGKATPRELASSFPKARTEDTTDAAKRAIDAAAKMLGKDISKGGAPKSRATTDYAPSGASRGGKGHHSLKGRSWRTSDEKTVSQTVPSGAARGGAPPSPSIIVQRAVDALMRSEERLDRRRAQRADLLSVPVRNRDDAWKKKFDQVNRAIAAAERGRERFRKVLDASPDTQRQAIAKAAAMLLADINRTERSKSARATSFTTKRASEVLDIIRPYMPEHAMEPRDLESEIAYLKRRRDRLPKGPDRDELTQQIKLLSARRRRRS